MSMSTSRFDCEFRVSTASFEFRLRASSFDCELRVSTASFEFRLRASSFDCELRVSKLEPRRRHSTSVLPRMPWCAARPHPYGVRRFLAYGVLGLGVEVFFTSLSRALRFRDRRLVGQTYLWMLPIYGSGGLLLERLHARLVRRRVSPPVRALVATGAILAWEYGTGSLLRRALGDCPWRYRRGVTLHGYVRLDYAPYWYAAALLFELLQREVRKLDRARRTAERRARRSAMEAIGPGAGGAAGETHRTADRRRASRR